MKRWLTAGLAGLIVLGAGAALAAPLNTPPGRPGPVSIELSLLGSYATGIFDASAAEIVAHDPANQRLFVVNAAAGNVDVLDISDPTQPAKIFSLESAGEEAADGSVVVDGGVPNSVDVRGDLVAVAVQSEPKTDDGWVVFFTTDGTPINALRVGALPDMLTFTPDGRTLLVANEGEPADDYSVDPDGSVSIIDVSGPAAELSQANVRTATFHAWDDGQKELDPQVRVFGRTTNPERRISENLEPEYVAAEDSRTAYVVLQEANAMAVLDIRSGQFSDIWPFGFKDHLVAGNELDVSDDDDAIRIENWPVFGMYEPDGFDSYRFRGQTLLVTANEGDSREWEGYSEIRRFRAFTEDKMVCPDSRLDNWLDNNPLGINSLGELRDNANMGRLNITTSMGLGEGGCIAEAFSFGGRSFAIWSGDGTQLYDSGSDFERTTAAQLDPENFNANHTANTGETRSDDKGPEPEGVTIGKVAGRTYAFIGLERVGGVMVYDITDPRAPYLVQYINNRDFNAEPGTPEAGDLGPEGVLFIDAADSPIGVSVLAVANEVSGTTTLFRVDTVTPGRGQKP